MQEPVPVAVLLKQVDRVGTRVIGQSNPNSEEFQDSVEPDEEPEKRRMKPVVINPVAETWIRRRSVMSLWSWYLGMFALFVLLVAMIWALLH